MRSLREHAGGVAEPVRQHPWCIGYGQLSYRHREKNLNEIIVPLLHWLASPRHIRSVPVIVANLVTLLLAFAILGLKFHYARRERTGGPG